MAQQGHRTQVSGTQEKAHVPHLWGTLLPRHGHLGPKDWSSCEYFIYIQRPHLPDAETDVQRGSIALGWQPWLDWDAGLGGEPLSHARHFATLWTVACQAPLSMQLSRHEYCRGLPFPSPGVLPDPRTEPRSPTLHADSLPSEPPGNPRPRTASL